ncbi:hypothetical protein [Streptomyces gobiensis]|uniref:hypothetical protein n=1 Tax=Streptomyces gobiensis TaxID=2875706 RepID=UPI001E45F1A0|nr:hypothetical protein [Streptomyces gobiensis]UGY93158.1 hypothetical protein test1122_16520 [Streptomyces gobiensis]
MPHREGDHVEYRDKQNKTQAGLIQEAQSSGQQMRYVVENDRTQKQERVTEEQIQRKLED